MAYNGYEPMMDTEHFAELFVVEMAVKQDKLLFKDSSRIVERYKDGDNNYFIQDNYIDEIKDTLTTDFNDGVNYNLLVDMYLYNEQNEEWQKKFISNINETVAKGKQVSVNGETIMMFTDEQIKDIENKYTPVSIQLMKSFTEKVRYFKNKKNEYDMDIRMK